MAEAKRKICTAAEWAGQPFKDAKYEALIGSAENPIIRPGTKNFVEAPEKCFKTTLLMRLMVSLASGTTLFPSLPVVRGPMRVLYLHGELSMREIEDRFLAAIGQKTVNEKTQRAVPIEKLDGFFMGKHLSAHLIRNRSASKTCTADGQSVIEGLVKEYKPEILVLDPWQSFISGYDDNVFKDVSQALSFLDRLIETYTLTFFMAVHAGKDSSKGARGSSALGGWRDTNFLLKKRGSEDDKQIVAHIEPRWAEPPNPFKLRFENGTVYAETVFTGIPSNIRFFIEQFQTQHGASPTKSDLRAWKKTWTNMKDDTFRKNLQRAVQHGAIKIVGETLELTEDPQ